jgi:hypothetical protein
VPSLTQRLKLKRHTLADRFRIQDYADNWSALDDFPGTYICTSSTRPSDWAAAQEGMAIYETDTRLVYRWDGDSFEREHAQGLMARNSRTTPISTTSTTYSSVIATPPTTYGTRRNLVIVEAPGVYSTEGLTGLSIWRDTTMLTEWVHQGWTGADAQRQPRPLSFVTTDEHTGGSRIYSLQFKAVIGYGGTCYVNGGLDKPIAITVVEI